MRAVHQAQGDGRIYAEGARKFHQGVGEQKGFSLCGQRHRHGLRAQGQAGFREADVPIGHAAPRHGGGPVGADQLGAHVPAGGRRQRQEGAGLIRARQQDEARRFVHPDVLSQGALPAQAIRPLHRRARRRYADLARGFSFAVQLGEGLGVLRTPLGFRGEEIQTGGGRRQRHAADDSCDAFARFRLPALRLCAQAVGAGE
mmetsp:Transcript_78552/g.240343  ORF Transcript_78552/g.240343 Transcript_78552/m.240343 type:complete len:201 (-) Transcript_78552:626-1228(-)